MALGRGVSQSALVRGMSSSLTYFHQWISCLGRKGSAGIHCGGCRQAAGLQPCRTFMRGFFLLITKTRPRRLITCDPGAFFSARMEFLTFMPFTSLVICGVEQPLELFLGDLALLENRFNLRSFMLGSVEQQF